MRLADAGEAADLAAFLGRLLHYDRAAAVRLQAGGGVLAVFGRPPSFEVIAIRTVRLSEPGGSTLDVTVSAGDLLEGVAEARAEVSVPSAVTGPPWAGVLPPRGGWRPVEGLPEVPEMARAVAAAVAEFRRRDEELPEERRTRAERDRIGHDIWSRTLGGTGLPLRAVHAARSVGFLRPPGAAPGAGEAALFAAGSWLRLRTAYGSIAVRAGGAGLGGLPGLSVLG
ncbi:hypothetical protein JFN87_29525 [Streptomyces bomunensis]|uniref:Uncharacterized protein n=1 Tax=Streptomyces montanisoli TaxID=2798581 RepID=A0A940MLG2_9ACTN|nr:hypothetical protein [Streptomyces montanisoli]